MGALHQRPPCVKGAVNCRFQAIDWGIALDYAMHPITLYASIRNPSAQCAHWAPPLTQGRRWIVHPRNCTINWNFQLTNVAFWGIITLQSTNAVKRRVRWQDTVREPWQVRVGTMEAAEHGLGAGAVRETKPSSGAPVTAPTRCPNSNHGVPAKADGLCGEEEKPRHRRNFLLAGNGAL